MGIYIHIPFCKKACHYCDFHFSTSLRYKDDMLKAILKEIELRQDYLGNKEINTIYFGGGTPSLLSEREIHQIMEQIDRYFTITKDAEITLEANPDDLSGAKISSLKKTAVNRLSIGVQSFFNEDLKWMNRAHESGQCDAAIKLSQDAGFENITIDLIYGYPLLSDDKWLLNIQKSLDMQIPHLSCYSMTVEPQTALDHFIKKGMQVPLDEAKSASQFITLIEKLQTAGYEHYEISNFAKPGKYSKHNTNYWRGVEYLGVGPSAHSFDQQSRQWNVANNQQYLSALSDGSIPAERESLKISHQVNEYIMTSLRTMWGLDLAYLEKKFQPFIKNGINKSAQQFLKKAWLNLDDKCLKLTNKGKLYADHIAAELFIEDEL